MNRRKGRRNKRRHFISLWLQRRTKSPPAEDNSSRIICYNVYKLMLCSPMINARATFISKCKESERDKHTASFIRDVLESDTSFF